MEFLNHWKPPVLTHQSSGQNSNQLCIYDILDYVKINHGNVMLVKINRSENSEWKKYKWHRSIQTHTHVSYMWIVAVNVLKDIINGGLVYYFTQDLVLSLSNIQYQNNLIIMLIIYIYIYIPILFSSIIFFWINEEQLWSKYEMPVFLTWTRKTRLGFRNSYTNRNHNRMFRFPRRSMRLPLCDGNPIFSFVSPPLFWNVRAFIYTPRILYKYRTFSMHFSSCLNSFTF